ncbi:MAG: hypothetical protein ABI442_16770 [Gemmatimonadaceae bacterium]
MAHIDGVWIPIIMFTSFPVMLIGYPIARAFAKRIENQPQQPMMPHEMTDRLERMEQAIDSIAIEVERIAEGQRFTTKLLAERATGIPGAPNAASPPRSTNLPEKTT